ncbi:hypothetical protein lerEdw1_003219, partial [Lerista edwardsae]
MATGSRSSVRKTIKGGPVVLMWTKIAFHLIAAWMLLREEVSQLQEEVHLLRQMKDMLTKDLEEAHGGKSPEILSATELKVQLAQKEQELARAKEALQ